MTETSPDMPPDMLPKTVAATIAGPTATAGSATSVTGPAPTMPPLSAAGDGDFAAFAAMTDVSGVVGPGDDRLAPWLVEPRDKFRGRAAVMLRPRNTAEVAAMLAHCNARRLPVIPVSGGTGLVAGQLTAGEAIPDPVLIALDRMDRIRDISPADNALVAEAGVTLEAVQNAAAEAGRLFPLAMASQGSCRIGGNLATNAGGVQVLRYGNARDLVLGVEAVMADGSVHHGLKRLRKDNMGYDLKGLLVGSEGTLGLITAASLKLFPAPGEVVTAMLAVPSPTASLDLLHATRARLGDGVTAFEIMAAQGPAFIAAQYPDWTDPLAGAPDWRVLIEVTGPTGGGLQARAEAALETLFEEGLATDGVVAASEAQRRAFWWVRETIPEANRKVGAVSSHDVSVPLSAIPEFIERTSKAVAEAAQGLRTNCFGHVGDGNLHYNLFPPEGERPADWKKQGRAGREAVHETALALGGSISAEHGIGRAKRDALAAKLDPAKLAAMRAIKRALDPNGILNPGAVLAREGVYGG
ncbi:MAG: FAD-binding oxidoreductase [Pseudomonadota bacterium]